MANLLSLWNKLRGAGGGEMRCLLEPRSPLFPSDNKLRSTYILAGVVKNCAERTGIFC